MQSLLEAPHVQKDVLVAMLHAAAKLSIVEGAHRSADLSGAGAVGVGFHAAQGASLQGFQRCLQWPQQWFADGKAYCAVRYVLRDTDAFSSYTRSSNFARVANFLRMHPCLREVSAPVYPPNVPFGLPGVCPTGVRSCSGWRIEMYMIEQLILYDQTISGSGSSGCPESDSCAMT